jgi:hypothetical protein
MKLPVISKQMGAAIAAWSAGRLAVFHLRALTAAERKELFDLMARCANPDLQPLS